MHRTINIITQFHYPIVAARSAPDHIAKFTAVLTQPAQCNRFARSLHPQ